MSTGYFLRKYDRTTCGGAIFPSQDKFNILGLPVVRAGDSVTCGKDGKVYQIMGSVPKMAYKGIGLAGSIHSKSTCPCMAELLPSCVKAKYSTDHMVLSPSAMRASVFDLGPPQHAQAVKKNRIGVDAGFCIIPQQSTTESFEDILFAGKQPDGTRELYRSLNGAGKEYKAGSILLVVDPDKQNSEQITHVQAAKARVDTALAPLSHQQADFLYKHKAAIEMFAAAASTASDTYGYSGQVTEAAKGYFERVEKILIEIEKTYKNQYITSGTLIGEQFFIERRQLFSQLDNVLKMFMKHRFMFNEYADLKSALGLSSRSITHKWNETGVSDIEGYATHIEKAARYVKLMETAGKIGLGLSALDTASKITEACTVGRDCAKTAFTSVGEFSGSIFAGKVSSKILAGSATDTICSVVLGAATFEAGGAGALLCTLGVAGSVSYGSDKTLSAFGDFLGEKLYEVISDDQHN
uniref:PAAR domain-containing protein n=1 Tax=Serratia marcescens TaxID=615 RepID=A0A9X8VGX6_SERMA